MTDGQRFKPIDPLDKDLLKEAERRWREARRTMPGVVERDRRTCRALAKPVSHISGKQKRKAARVSVERTSFRVLPRWQLGIDDALARE